MNETSSINQFKSFINDGSEDIMNKMMTPICEMISYFYETNHTKNFTLQQKLKPKKKLFGFKFSREQEKTLDQILNWKITQNLMNYFREEYESTGYCRWNSDKIRDLEEELTGELLIRPPPLIRQMNI